jgi:Putative beta-barrel porin-2, OmpL-like. bbp2
MKIKLSVMAVLATLSAGAYAADAPVPTLSQVLDASGISLTGYTDVAYSKMNTTGLFVGAPAGPIVGGMAGNSRIFDTQGATQGKDYSGFSLHQAAFTLSKQPKEGVGGLVNVTAGEDAATVASNGLGANTSAHSADLTQAYMSYATGGLTVIGGKFATLAGAELITSPSNSEYSRAWMFGWGPYTHTGVRATYVINDKVTVIGGVNNGFDQAYATTGTRTSELSLVLAPVSMFTLAVTNYHGKEVAATATGGTRNYTDVLATLNATDKLNFVADYANAWQDNANTAAGTIGRAKWKALALYANYQLTDAVKLSYRHEGFNDPDGYRSGIAQNLKSNTIDVGYQVAKPLLLRAELRKDTSSVASFQKADGTGTNSQTSFALESIYTF